MVGTSTSKEFLRDQIVKERLRIGYCKIDLQLTDNLAKPLKHARFEDLKGLTKMEA